MEILAHAYEHITPHRQAPQQDEAANGRKSVNLTQCLGGVVFYNSIRMHYVGGLSPALRQAVYVYSCNHLSSDLENLAAYARGAGIKKVRDNAAPRNSFNRERRLSHWNQLTVETIAPPDESTSVDWDTSNV